MGAKAKRQAIATALKANLPSGWVVYPSPPTSLVAQSAVISPRSPYIIRQSVGIDAVSLQITLLVNLAAGPTAMDILDDAIDNLRAGILNSGDVMWEAVEDIGVAQEVGGVDYLTASINIQVL